jgi:hypothetical protein
MISVSAGSRKPTSRLTEGIVSSCPRAMHCHPDEIAVTSTGTPSSSICREVGSSSSDGQPRHVKIVHAGGVAGGDLGLFVVWHPGQDLREDLPRLGKRRLTDRGVQTAPRWIAKLPSWLIDRRMNCALPGANFIAPNRRKGSVAI